MEDYKKIRYTKLHVTLQFTEATELVRDKASALRGGIGEMLLRANCIADRDCEHCGFYHECIVQRIMYSQFDVCPPSVHAGDSVGYILYCSDHNRFFEQGDTLEFTLTLFGKTIVYFNQYLQAIYSLGQCGLGAKQSHFVVQSVTNLYGKPILENGSVYMAQYRYETIGDYIMRRKKKLAAAQELRMCFVTPLSMKYQGEYVTGLAAEPIKAGLLRRLMILSYFENILCENKEAYEPEESFPQMREVTSANRKVSRYSSRHDTNMMLKGITGEAALSEIAPQWLELLIAGEIVQIGKETSFGFGKYRLRESRGEES